MNELKVSVIVPVYNASKYLRSCIDSILAQTLTEFELICVDDGSTDESPSILKEYERADSRVRIITQSNQYAGTARNTGKAVAKGEYLVFWDSDDLFKPNALEDMYRQCKLHDADVCICSASQFFDDLQKTLPSDGFIKKSVIPAELPFNQATCPDHILNVTTAHPWNKMYRRAYIEGLGLDFQTTRTGDDIFFVISAIARAERITVINKALICYRINQPSSLSGNLTASPLIPIDNWLTTREYLLAHNAFPKRSFDNKMMGSLVYFLHNIIDWNAFCETFLYIKNVVVPKLEIEDPDGDYFYNPFHEECVSHIRSDSPEEFLVFFSHATYRQRSVLSGKNQQLSHKLRLEKKAHVTAENELTSTKKKLKTARRRLKAKKLENETIKASLSYRIGRMITFIPRKIAGLIKRK